MLAEVELLLPGSEDAPSDEEAARLDDTGIALVDEDARLLEECGPLMVEPPLLELDDTGPFPASARGTHSWLALHSWEAGQSVSLLVQRGYSGQPERMVTTEMAKRRARFTGVLPR